MTSSLGDMKITLVTTANARETPKLHNVFEGLNPFSNIPCNGVRDVNTSCLLFTSPFNICKAKARNSLVIVQNIMLFLTNTMHP